ncbi:MAG TPA: MoxR family ATPase [Elusimicrobiota bacterium]|nr:MoxR family ATPase [Elusimicrobiota bacterium]
MMTDGSAIAQSSKALSLLELQPNIEKIFVGKPEVVHHALVTLLAGGHLLIEDVPGVGKTTLALSMARSIGCSFQRIQCTSDLLPSDILGVSLPDAKTQQFTFHKGPLFHQIILVDELNRATPRTQSALLESMNERQVTIDNETHLLPRPFFVVATQNPHEHHGTFPLPESQLDRFMMRLSIGYPAAKDEKAILAAGEAIDALRDAKPCLTAAELLEAMERVALISVAPVVDDYLLSLVHATRRLDGIDIGVSPRGAQALRRAAQAAALLSGRAHVIPDDVKALAVPVFAHRLRLPADQLSSPRSHTESLIEGLIQSIPVPL